MNRLNQIWKDLSVSWPAAMIAGLPVNRSRVLMDGSRRCRIKTRCWHSRLMIAAGNGIYRIWGVPFRILTGAEWAKREELIHYRLYGEDVRRDKQGQLILPMKDGIDLADLLGSPVIPWDAKREALKDALQALARLHDLAGEGAPFSHGDAIVSNVVCLPSDRAACWVDFETVHISNLSSLQRQADDIRAFVMSAARYLPAGRLKELFDLAGGVYQTPALWEQVRYSLMDLNYGRTVVYAAQAKMRYAQWIETRSAVLRLLEEKTCALSGRDWSLPAGARLAGE
ncbi:MAG: hypothetical protein Q8Q08_05505 [Candidatus Omnitrophota bacterium]|nr:hypothetical protein [Candidatus Omnitrophota bacterium]MDZ4242514.1 hypothetical protein [Candidatus Omnitrophota bacterium]